MERLKVIDAFRGISILGVMLYHYTTPYRIYDPSFDPLVVFKYGYLGVQFFFIISGFVIFLTLHHCASSFDFLYKRFTRLYPTFWFCLSLTFIVLQLYPVKRADAIGITDFLVNFTMIPGFFNTPKVDGAYWSLAPEIFFYLAMAFLFFFRRYKPWIAWGVVIILLTWCNSFFWHTEGKPLHLLNMSWGPLFFAGILFYMIREDRKNLLLHILVVISFVSVCLNFREHEAWWILAAIFAAFYLFVFQKLDWLGWKPLVFTGRISFPLYLIHQNLGYAVLTYTKNNIASANLRVLLAAGTMILAAFIIHRAVELPSIRLLRRFFRKPVITNAMAAG